MYVDYLRVQKYEMIIRNRTTKFSGSLMGYSIFLPVN